MPCSDKDADRRYQSAKELLVDLRRLQPSSSVTIQRNSPRTDLSAWRKGIAYGTTALVVLLAGLLAANVGGWRDRMVGRPHSPQIRSLAVLPFENLSGDREQDYFADGMTESLITDLGQIEALRVISRTSVMKYRGARMSLIDVARELRVDALIEGSVSQALWTIAPTH